MRVGKCPLGVSIALVDGLHLQVKAMPLCLCCRPLNGRYLLEHGGPQLEAPVLVGEILVFPAQDMLRLGQGHVSHAHGHIQGNVI
jgi:hypothetical protein